MCGSSCPTYAERTSEERLCGRMPDTDATGRVAGGVHQLEVAIKLTLINGLPAQIPRPFALYLDLDISDVGCDLNLVHEPRHSKVLCPLGMVADVVSAAAEKLERLLSVM